jgi:hypothetical protein
MNIGNTIGTISDLSSDASDYGERTKVFGGAAGYSMHQAKDTVQANAANYDINEKTFIGVTPSAGSNDGSQPGSGTSSGGGQGSPRSTRKIVGWLISYTIDPMGMDYRLYEGNNPIGRDTNNTIILMKDPTISGKHLNILFKQGRYWAKDEMSANGSFINGEEMEISKPYELNDGDTLKLGDTVFKFKSSL